MVTCPTHSATAGLCFHHLFSHTLPDMFIQSQLVSFRSLPFQDDALSVRGNGWIFQGVFRFNTVQVRHIHGLAFCKTDMLYIQTLEDPPHKPRREEQTLPEQ